MLDLHDIVNRLIDPVQKAKPLLAEIRYRQRYDIYVEVYRRADHDTRKALVIRRIVCSATEEANPQRRLGYPNHLRIIP